MPKVDGSGYHPAMKTHIVVEKVRLPALAIHGGAGSYLKSTTQEQRFGRGDTLARVARSAHAGFEQSSQAAVLAAIAQLESDPQFNAGYGCRLQRDGQARLSASLMGGSKSRLSAVYNVRDCRHPSQLAALLQTSGDRNLDAEGARQLMRDHGIACEDLRTEPSIKRWRKLVALGDEADREAAIGSADDGALEKARQAQVPLPRDLRLPAKENRYGTVGAVACDASADLWACTSTGGRGHEAVGRISDSPTPAGNYACPAVALSATGFGEQILDLNICGRIATRMLDGASLEAALQRTFAEVEQAEAWLGVLAISPDGYIGYAHTTEACGVAWYDGDGKMHIDRHGRRSS